MVAQPDRITEEEREGVDEALRSIGKVRDRREQRNSRSEQ